MDKTVAVLGRTNLILRPVEQALSEAGVRYHLLSHSGYWASSEVRSVLSYLGCVHYPADWLLAGAVRAPFFPSRYLPKTTLLQEMKERASEDFGYWKQLIETPQNLVPAKNLSSLREFVSFIHSLSRYKSLPPDEALKSVIQALRAVEYYRDEAASPDNDPIANLVELTKLAARHDSLKGFLDYCRRASAASKGRKGVALSTIHSFKGMEADEVYVIGVNDGILPHKKSTDLAEEQNIWFTACSRPKSRLVITYSGEMSPFLKDLKVNELATRRGQETCEGEK